jgi:hypothetical protein
MQMQIVQRRLRPNEVDNAAGTGGKGAVYRVEARAAQMRMRAGAGSALALISVIHQHLSLSHCHVRHHCYTAHNHPNAVKTYQGKNTHT